MICLGLDLDKMLGVWYGVWGRWGTGLWGNGGGILDDMWYGGVDVKPDRFMG